MAALNDTSLGSDDSSGTTLSCADAINVTAGDLVVAHTKFEGATTTVTFDTGAATPTFTVANPVLHHATNNDLNSATASWIATSTGTVTVRVVLGGARTFRKIRAYSDTPAGGTTLQLDAVAAAEQTATGAPSSGAASATAAGAAFGFFALYGSEQLTPGTGWSEAAELNVVQDAVTEYQHQAGAGSLTADGDFGGGAEDVIAHLAIFKEVAAGGGAQQLQPWQRQGGMGALVAS